MATDNRFIKIDGAFSRPTIEQTLARSRAMLAQTQAEGSAPFAGSSFDTQGAITPQTTTGAGGGLLPNSPTQPSAPGISQPTTSSDAFNQLMMQLLEGAKGVTNVDLLKRKRELERESVARTSAPTEESLRTLSPAQQGAIRSGSINALSPEIDENTYQLKKAEAATENFFAIFDRAQKISKETAANMSPPEESLAAMSQLIKNNPDKFDEIYGSLNEKGQSALIKKLAADNVSLTVPERGSSLSVSDQQKVTESTKLEASQSYELGRSIGFADELLRDLNSPNPALAGAFGRTQQFIPEKLLGGDTAFLFNKLEQLKQGIVIILRAKLKGQGTITDDETVMLERASTAISRNLDIEKVKSEVAAMRGFLEFQKSQVSSGSSASVAETKVVGGITYKKVQGGWQAI